MRRWRLWFWRYRMPPANFHTPYKVSNKNFSPSPRTDHDDSHTNVARSFSYLSFRYRVIGSRQLSSIMRDRIDCVNQAD